MSALRRRIVLRVMASLVCLNAGAAQAPLSRADRLAEEGLARQRAGDFKAAVAAYESALELAPERVDVLSNLGAAHAALGDYEQAVRRYQAALKGAPALTSVRLNLGIAYYKAHQFEQAVETLREVRRADASLEQARLLLGLALYSLERHDEAVTELEAAYQAQPANRGAAYALATVYVARGEKAKAADLIERVFASLDSAETYLLTGSLKLADGDYAGAIEQLTRASKLKPDLPKIHAKLGEAYQLSGEREAAAAAYAQELRIEPRDFDAAYRLASMHLQDERPADALPLLERALRLRPGNVAVLFLLGVAHRDAGRSEDAVRLLEQVVRLEPSRTPAHVILAQLYYRLGRKEDAERERAIIERLNAETQKKELQP